jgi:MarR family transcriptional regulator, lower aerobic nicotinate degradation pathway regulator
VSRTNIVGVTYYINYADPMGHGRAGSPREEARNTSGGRLGIVDSMAQLSFTVFGFLERRAAAHGLSLIQIRLLGVLRDRKPPMHELAKLLGLDKSSVTGLVDRAEKRGLVRRMPSTVDRRAVLVHLTREGRSIGTRVSRDFEADVSLFVRSLSDRERDLLSELATRVLVAHAEAHGVDLFANTDT